MAIRRRPAVTDERGEGGKLRRVRAEHGEPLAVIELRNGKRVEVPFERLEHHEDGGYFFRGRWSEAAAQHAGGLSIPIVEERVTTTVQPGPEQHVRVRRRLVTKVQEVETPVWHERIEVERVAVNAYVERVPEPRHEGDTLIIPCVEEVVVTRLCVREELRVRVVREQNVDRQSVVLRRHEVDVTRDQPESTKPKKH